MEKHENMDENLPDFLTRKGTKTGFAPSGFQLPDGYFSTFGDRFFEKKGGDTAPFLNEKSTVGDGFSVPEKYFEKLPERLFEKIKTGEKTVELPQKRPFFNIARRPAALAAAASVAVLMVALGIFFSKKAVVADKPIACNTACLSEKISAEDVQTYLEENLAEFSADELSTDELLGEINFPPAKKHQEIDLDADDAEPLLREMLDELSEEELENML